MTCERCPFGPWQGFISPILTISQIEDSHLRMLIHNLLYAKKCEHKKDLVDLPNFLADKYRDYKGVCFDQEQGIRDDRTGRMLTAEINTDALSAVYPDYWDRFRSMLSAPDDIEIRGTKEVWRTIGSILIACYPLATYGWLQPQANDN